MSLSAGNAICRPACVVLALFFLTVATQAEEDEERGGNPLVGGPNDVHALVLDESAAIFRQGSVEGVAVTEDPAAIALDSRPVSGGADGPYRGRHDSRIIRTDFPFNEIVPSWNVVVPAGSGFFVEIRLGLAGSDAWTSDYYFGTWGETGVIDRKIVRDEHGEVFGDCLMSRRLFDRMQYRVHFFAASGGSPVLRRFAIAYSNTCGDADFARRFRRPVDPGPKEKWARRLPVPFRSQRWESPDLRGRCCSPTSVAMVLDYYGVSQSTARVSEVIYDPEHRIYGTWNRAVQGAFTFGVPGYIERFGDWNAVRRHIAAGRPVIISIIVAADEFKGASPYRSSDGHLIVLTGFDDEGNVYVNDPAGSTPERGRALYPKVGVERAWFGHGGVGYVLLPPGEGLSR